MGAVLLGARVTCWDGVLQPTPTLCLLEGNKPVQAQELAVTLLSSSPATTD